MKKYQGVLTRAGKAIGRIDMYADDSLTQTQAIQCFNQHYPRQVGEYDTAYDVTVDRLELVEEKLECAVIIPHVA